MILGCAGRLLGGKEGILPFGGPSSVSGEADGPASDGKLLSMPWILAEIVRFGGNLDGVVPDRSGFSQKSGRLD